MRQVKLTKALSTGVGNLDAAARADKRASLVQEAVDTNFVKVFAAL